MAKIFTEMWHARKIRQLVSFCRDWRPNAGAFIVQLDLKSKEGSKDEARFYHSRSAHSVQPAPAAGWFHKSFISQSMAKKFSFGFIVSEKNFPFE